MCVSLRSSTFPLYLFKFRMIKNKYTMINYLLNEKILREILGGYEENY